MGLVVGLDAHAKTCVYRVKDDDGTLVGEGTFPSTPADLSILAEAYPGATVVVEASSVTEWIYDLLTDRGMSVVPVHPTNIRRVLGMKRDEVDAGFLIDAYRLGALPRSYVPPKRIRALRQLYRQAAFLTKERTRLKNRVHAILKRRGIRLLDRDEEDVPDLFAMKHGDRLLVVGDPEIPVLLHLIDAVTEKHRFIQLRNHSIRIGKQMDQCMWNLVIIEPEFYVQVERLLSLSGLNNIPESWSPLLFHPLPHACALTVLDLPVFFGPIRTVIDRSSSPVAISLWLQKLRSYRLKWRT